jgi:hypothetical protein
MHKFYFSDWLIIWFILYKFKIIIFNPKLIILFGMIENIIWFGFLFKHTNNLNNYICLSIHFTIKILMLYLLESTDFKLNDIVAGIIFYIIYNIYLKLFYNESIIEYYIKRINYYKKNF